MMTQASLSAAAPPNKGNPCPAPGLKWRRLARRGEHSCLCAVAKPSTSPGKATASLAKLPRKFLIANDSPTRIASLSDHRESKGLSFQSLPLKPSPSSLPWKLCILIANPELELNVSPIRINGLRFSNRKFSAIFPFIFLTLKDPHPRPVILKASDQDARPKGSQLAPHSIPSQQTQVKLLIETPRFRIPITPTKQIQSQFLIETNQPLCAATTLASPPTFRPFPPLC
jgi:hypothetical protein